MTIPLDGLNAIVTGGATGIGLAISRRLLCDGANVLVAAQTEDQLDAALPAMQDGFSRDRIIAFVGNLALPGTAAQMCEAAVSQFGGVDILVNNAGGGVVRPTLTHTEETIAATIDNNLWTTIRCCLAVLPHMRERGYGRIVNIGAESVRNGLLDHAIYNAAKGGVHGFSVGLAREFARDAITVNVVAPSYIRTPEIAALMDSGQASAGMEKVLGKAVAMIPLGRAGEVDEVAAAVAFLARPDSGYITGQVLSVNGGSSMGLAAEPIGLPRG
jgi:2,3-dihydroxy-2,3-dihydro-p-cumate dehydrogenase